VTEHSPVIAPRLGRVGGHARGVTTQKVISLNGIAF